MIARLLLVIALLLNCGICVESKVESKPADTDLRFLSVSYDIEAF